MLASLVKLPADGEEAQTPRRRPRVAQQSFRVGSRGKGKNQPRKGLTLLRQQCKLDGADQSFASTAVTMRLSQSRAVWGEQPAAQRDPARPARDVRAQRSELSEPAERLRGRAGALPREDRAGTPLSRDRRRAG